MGEWEDMKRSLKSTKGWDQLPHGLHLGIDMILATGDKEIARLKEELKILKRLRCRGARDGECIWEHCPQLRDGEPEKSGRHCPLDYGYDDEG